MVEHNAGGIVRDVDDRACLRREGGGGGETGAVVATARDYRLYCSKNSQIIGWGGQRDRRVVCETDGCGSGPGRTAVETDGLFCLPGCRL